MIYLTGGTGLLGSHLLYTLVQKGYAVRALRRSEMASNETLKVFGYYEKDPRTLFNKIEWVEGNLLDMPVIKDHLDGIEEIYHSAAMVSFDARDRKKMEAINIGGTAQLVDLAMLKNIKKFCFVSSVAAIGPRVGDHPADESCIWEKNNESHWYSWTKFKSEMEVWRGIAEGLQAVIVNPSIILGTGNWHRGSGQMFTTIHKGLAFYPPGITGYVAVEDVVNIMITLMEKGYFGERYIVTAEDLYFKDLFKWIAEALGSKTPGIKTKPWMMAVAWRLMWLYSKMSGNPPKITRESAKAGFNIRYFSNDKIKNLIGYDFMSIRESINKTAETYLAEIQS